MPNQTGQAKNSINLQPVILRFELLDQSHINKVIIGQSAPFYMIVNVYTFDWLRNIFFDWTDKKVCNAIKSLR